MNTEQELLDEALDALMQRWPRAWGQPTLRLQRSGKRRWDALVEVRLPDAKRPLRLAVEAKQRPTPLVAEQLASWIDDSDVDGALLVANWLSPRTREALIERGLNYADLTGNVYIALKRPKLFIQTEGASKDPGPKLPSERGLKGAKGGVIARTLADVTPPYTVTDLADATGLSPSFVSRVLAGLEREALIERRRRGAVTGVDLTRLIQRWVQDYGLLTSNTCTTYVFPAGAREFESKLAAAAPDPWAVTGSLGAVRLAPIAAPAMAIAYVDRPGDVARRLGLLPAESGANVILARPYDPVAYKRRWSRDGILYVSPSQLAADCLTGVGRMPNEGAELLKWLEANQQQWRARSLTANSPLEDSAA